jgi:pilus assembly protein CpaE
MITSPMNSSESTSDAIALPLFSVCADRDVVVAAMDAASAVPGAAFVGEFHDYITADKQPQFAPSLDAASACVALVDFDRDPDLALKTTERLRQIFFRKISIIALASHLSADLLLHAMRSGCSEYLTKPVAVAALKASLSRFHASMEGDIPMPRARGTAAALFGAKGGVGTTTLAVHLAMQVVQRNSAKTLLVDDHHQLGHIALYLGLPDAPYSFTDVLHNAARLDTDLLSGFICRHSSGLQVIASPSKRAVRTPSTSEDVQRVMAVLRREYDCVLLDTCEVQGERRPILFDHVDQIYLVATTDIAGLRDLSRHVEHFELSDAEREKTRLILNRTTDADALTPEQVAESVRIPVAAAIPDHRQELLQAINRGEPVSTQRKSQFNHQLTEWARRVSPAEGKAQTSKKGKKLFGFR